MVDTSQNPSQKVNDFEMVDARYELSIFFDELQQMDVEIFIKLRILRIKKIILQF
jgi:hypothetical protein